MLFYNSHFHLFLRKLKSKWVGPFVMKNVYPYRTVEIKNLKNGNEFKVKRQRLKLLLENSMSRGNFLLSDPYYYRGQISSCYLCLRFVFLCFSGYLILPLD